MFVMFGWLTDAWVCTEKYCCYLIGTCQYFPIVFGAMIGQSFVQVTTKKKINIQIN